MQYDRLLQQHVSFLNNTALT